MQMEYLGHSGAKQELLLMMKLVQLLPEAADFFR